MPNSENSRKGNGADAGEELRTVAHALLNYLSAITTFASLMGDDLEEEAPEVRAHLRGDVSEILGAAHEARSLGTQLSRLVSSLSSP